MAHTPTPWMLRQYKDGKYKAISIENAVACCDVATIDWKRGGIMEANAAFIVRACNAHDELVAAARAFLTASRLVATQSASNADKNGTYTNSECHRAIVDKIKAGEHLDAALAKAEEK